MRRITLNDIKGAYNEVKNYIKDHKEECTIYISLIGIGVGASMISYVVGAHKGVKAGYEAGIQAMTYKGNPGIGIFCGEKDKIKFVIDGVTSEGKLTHELVVSAEKGEQLLNDLRTCVTAAKTGVNANLIDDLYNMPPELVKLIKESGGEVFNF